MTSTLGFAENSSPRFPSMQCSFIELGLTDLEMESEANAINDLGQIAGSYWKEHSRFNTEGKLITVIEKKNFFIWSESEGLTLIDLPETCGIKALNNTGQVAGVNFLENDTQRAFIWDSSTGYTDLGSLGGDSTTFSGMNDNGQVVGSSLTDEGEWHAFVWNNDTMTDLGVFGAYESASKSSKFSSALAINNDGTIVGWSSSNDRPKSSFIWKNGEMKRFRPELNENYGALVLNINNNGEVLYLYNGDRIAESIEGDHLPVYLAKQQPAAGNLFNDNGDHIVGHRLFLNSHEASKIKTFDLNRNLPIGVTFEEWTVYPTSFKTQRYYSALKINDFNKDQIVGSGWSAFRGRQAIIWSYNRK